MYNKYVAKKKRVMMLFASPYKYVAIEWLQFTPPLLLSLVLLSLTQLHLGKLRNAMTHAFIPISISYTTIRSVNCLAHRLMNAFPTFYSQSV